MYLSELSWVIQTDIIELYYTNRDISCQKAFYMLSNLVKENNNLVLLAYDVDTTKGMTRAIEQRVKGVPLVIVNKDHRIKGKPFSESQILEKIGQK